MRKTEIKVWKLWFSMYLKIFKECWQVSTNLPEQGVRVAFM